MKDCELCRVVEKEDSSESKYLAGPVIRLPTSIAVLDKNQFYKGKFVVIFKKHVEDFADLTENERKKFTDDMIKVAKAIKKVLSPDRMNYATLGNIIPHLHWHIFPRYKTDSNWGKTPYPHGEHYVSDEEAKKLVNSIKKVLD